MCGQFVFIPQDELNRIILDVKRNLAAEKTANVSAEYQSVFPKADVPVIVQSNNRLETEVLKWGYPVSWEKGPVFNTRFETALGKPGNMWRASLEKRRCVVPSFGFFEPHKTETTVSPKTGKPIKQKYFFRLPNCNAVMMAGVYEAGHFSIMTTAPNRWMEPIHPRMPVILLPDEIDGWLNGAYTSFTDRSNIELVSEAVA